MGYPNKLPFAPKVDACWCMAVIDRCNVHKSVSGTNTTSATNVYDEQDRLHLVSYSKDYALTSSAANLTTSYQYDYTDTGNLEKLTMTSGNATYTYTPSYDALDRVASSSAVLSTPSGLLTNEIEYTYKVGSNSNQSLQVYKYHSWFGSNEVQYTYGYDSNGNITHIFLSTGENFRYVYDDIGQLVREDNALLNRTFVYTYDDAGNILSKRTYALTAAGVTPTTLYSTYSYGYDDSWGDLLTSYRGVSFTYDEIGNPLTYYNGSTTWTYTYDANGMRTRRTNGSTTYNYTYHGSQLTHMTYGSIALHFYYDASGRPLSVTYGGATYYYVLNLQGDVVAILNSSGAQVVGYTYDAWGRLLTVTGSMASTLGQYNPLRYRGYVYDRETGLYYLQSRYYNPTWGRFIGADNAGYLGADGMPLSCNLFAYCKNNPVMGYAPTGHWSWFAAGFDYESCRKFGSNGL